MIGEGDCGAVGGMKIGRGNLPQRHFVHHKSRGGKPATNQVVKETELYHCVGQRALLCRRSHVTDVLIAKR
jgi:hypothetical protein